MSFKEMHQCSFKSHPLTAVSKSTIIRTCTLKWGWEKQSSPKGKKDPRSEGMPGCPSLNLPLKIRFSQPPSILPDASTCWRDAGGPRESPGLLSALGSSSPCPEQCQAGGVTPSCCACLKDTIKLTHSAKQSFMASRNTHSFPNPTNLKAKAASEMPIALLRGMAAPLPSVLLFVFSAMRLYKQSGPGGMGGRGSSLLLFSFQIKTLSLQIRQNISSNTLGAIGLQIRL